MRTTLSIDDDLLSTVREIAQAQERTTGDVVSDLLRESLRPKSIKQEYRNGVPLLPRQPDAVRVTSELVNHIRDASE